MNLHSLFYPHSVAVIGASTKVGSVGNDICRNLTHSFTGKVYPINPKAEELYGLTCFPDITHVPGSIDLAIFAIPSGSVPQALRQAGEKGIKSAIIISAGFKEAGEKGLMLEDEIRSIVYKYNIHLIGPNCLGIINPEIGLNASFAPLMPQKGNIAFISQSGALCTSVLDYAKGLGIGFSKFISIGNKAATGEIELLEYLGQDTKTDVIMMYTEQINDAPRFLKTVSLITSGPKPKPVIILKAGKTSAGAAASASHTGSLGTNDAFIDAIFKKGGVIRAQSIEELFDYAVAFAHNPLPKGNRIAIITNAGGPGVLTADEAIGEGLELAQLSPSTISNLKTLLPPSANVHNPVDVLGDAQADRYIDALSTVMSDSGVDGAIVILTPQSMTQIDETARTIIESKRLYNKPVIASFMGLHSVHSGVQLLQEGHVSTISFPEYAAKSMGALVKFTRKNPSETESLLTELSAKEKVNQIFNKALLAGKKHFPEAEAREVLQAYGFPLLKTTIVRSAQMAAQASRLYSRPLVLKIVSPDIIHKSDVGGVMLNVKPQTVRQAYTQMVSSVKKNMPDARIDGVLLMEMAPQGGLELILGAKRDEQLSATMVMIGLGGIYVEVFKDIAFAPAPLTLYEARNLIHQIKASRIFEGVRGLPPYDTDALIDCIIRLSRLVTDFPEIVELDINPLMLYPRSQGAFALDARLSLK